MKFEIGKSYEHPSKKQMFITGKVNTILFGECFIAEIGQSHSNYFEPISMTGDAMDNWYEIPLELFKLKNFDLSKKDKNMCLRRLKLDRITNGKVRLDNI